MCTSFTIPFAKLRGNVRRTFFGEVGFLLALDGPGRTVAMLSVRRCPVCPEFRSYYVPSIFGKQTGYERTGPAFWLWVGRPLRTDRSRLLVVGRGPNTAVNHVIHDDLVPYYGFSSLTHAEGRSTDLGVGGGEMILNIGRCGNYSPLSNCQCGHACRFSLGQKCL